MFKLYHFPLCPFSRRARLALSEYGLEAELIETRPWALSPQFLKLNPAGNVPVLSDNDGIVIAGIEAIGEYLEEIGPKLTIKQSLLPGSAVARAEIRRLIAWFDVKFYQEVTRNLVEEKINRQFAARQAGRDGAPNMDLVRQGLKNIRFHLDYISHLSDQRGWLAGNELSLADLAAASHISCLDYLGDVAWGSNEAAKIWYQRVKSRPSFRPLLVDHIAGISPSRIYAELDF